MRGAKIFSNALIVKARRCLASLVKDITFFRDSRQQIETECHCSGSPQEKDF